MKRIDLTRLGSRFDRKLEWLVLLVAATAALVTAAGVLRMALPMLAAPRVAYEPIEAGILMGVDALRQRGGFSALYPAAWADQYPLIITPYPPVFHLVWAGLASLPGMESSYLPGRIAALAALLGCAVLIYASAREVGAGRLSSVAFAALFLTPVPVAKWAGLARVDIPGLFLTLLGLWVYLRTQEREDRSYLWSAIPFAIAGLTKQTLVAAPAAAILSELVRRRYSRAGLLALAVGGSVVASFIILEMVTGGGFLNATIRSFNKQVFYLVGFNLTADFIASLPVPGLLLLFVLAPLVLRRPQRDAVVLYLILSLAVLALTVGKPGANVNYFIEPMAAVCIAAAAGLAQLRTPRLVRLTLTAVLAIATLWSGIQLLPQYDRIRYGIVLWRATVGGGFELPAVARGDGPILAPPATYALLAEPHQPLYLNDDYTFSVMAAQGRFPKERIVQDLLGRRISAVLIDRRVLRDRRPAFVGDWQNGWNFWSVPGFRQALFEAYDDRRDVEIPGGWRLFVQKEAPAEDSAE